MSWEQWNLRKDLHHELSTKQKDAIPDCDTVRDTKCDTAARIEQNKHSKTLDALYFALLHHTRAHETAQDSARIRFAGSYKLWRFSVEHENEFVLGRIDIEEDDVTHALKVKMRQPKKLRPGMRGTSETAFGYMYRLSNMYVLLLTVDLTDDLHVTIFPRSKMDAVGTTDINPNSIFAGEHEHVVHLDGFGLGWMAVPVFSHQFICRWSMT